MTDDMKPCACRRPFVPEQDFYAAHVQTFEHQRWRLGVERGRPLAPDEAMEELYGIILPRDNAEPVDVSEWLPSAFRAVPDAA